MNQKLYKNQPFTLSEMVAASADSLPKIQLMKTGTFTYFEPNDMKVETQTFNQMIFNFQRNIRGVELAVDYNHNAYDRAAGWIKNLSLSDDGEQLWADIEWTPEAAEAIKSKEYKYISAEFSYDYVDDEGKHCGPTLFGAGLTNRPFLKNMQEVECNESNKEQSMSMEEVKKLSDHVAKLCDKIEAMESSLKEKDEQIKRLSQESTNRKEESAKEEKTLAFNSMLKEGKVVEAQREAFMSGDTKRFAELSQPIKFENVGHSQEKTQEKNIDNMTPDEAEEELARLAKETAEKKNIPLSEANKVVIFAHPKLAEKYQSKFQ